MKNCFGLCLAVASAFLPTVRGQLRGANTTAIETAADKPQDEPGLMTIEEVPMTTTGRKLLVENTNMRVTCSEDGRFVIVLDLAADPYNNKNRMHTMSGKAADGTWVAVDGGLTNVVMDNHGTFYGVSEGPPGNGQVWKRDWPYTSNDWEPYPAGYVMKHISTTGSGGIQIGVASDYNVLLRYGPNNNWLGTRGSLVKTAINNIGTLAVGFDLNGWLFILDVKAAKPVLDGVSWTNPWQPLTLPWQMDKGAKILEVAIGGNNHIWMVDQYYHLYSGWIVKNAGGAHIVKHWTYMKIRVSSMGVAWTGAMFGGALDGKGVIYCRNPDPIGYETRCEYIIGPGGVAFVA